MSHWRHTMVDGTKFWISYQWLAYLSSFSHWQVIQNSTPSTIVWRQCDIWIEGNFAFLYKCNSYSLENIVCNGCFNLKEKHGGYWKWDSEVIRKLDLDQTCLDSLDSLLKYTHTKQKCIHKVKPNLNSRNWKRLNVNQLPIILSMPSGLLDAL